jgi:hypothetical protein
MRAQERVDFATRLRVAPADFSQILFALGRRYFPQRLSEDFLDAFFGVQFGTCSFW